MRYGEEINCVCKHCQYSQVWLWYPESTAKPEKQTQKSPNTQSTFWHLIHIKSWDKWILLPLRTLKMYKLKLFITYIYIYKSIYYISSFCTCCGRKGAQRGKRKHRWSVLWSGSISPVLCRFYVTSNQRKSPLDLETLWYSKTVFRHQYETKVATLLSICSQHGCI